MNVSAGITFQDEKGRYRRAYVEYSESDIQDLGARHLIDVDSLPSPLKYLITYLEASLIVAQATKRLGGADEEEVAAAKAALDQVAAPMSEKFPLNVG